MRKIAESEAKIISQGKLDSVSGDPIRSSRRAE
jgi:hypothetical protein